MPWAEAPSDAAKSGSAADGQPESSELANNDSAPSIFSRGHTLSPLSPRAPREGRLRMPHRALRVASLNLGGRNTSPVEFELKGESSEAAVEAMAVLRRAEKSFTDTKRGPIALLSSERKLIAKILEEIYGRGVASEQRQTILKLLWSATWGEIYSYVRANSPHLFNAFNLPTLLLKRPAVWEDPASCSSFNNTKDYLTAWLTWYQGLDRQGDFWLKEAPRIAEKKSLDVATGFAGLLLFDVMSLFVARGALSPEGEEMGTEEAHWIPFRKISKFASHLPATSFKARHTAAYDLLEATEAHVLLAQEARKLAAHPSMAKDFLPPFSSLDGFTAVFLRNNMFAEATDISSDVAKQMQSLIDVEERFQRAWQTTAKRLAAVICKCHPHIGGFRVCFVSLHCSRSDGTAAFLAALRDVLADYSADLHVLGVDTGCGGKETFEFRHRLTSAGFDIGCPAHQDQVTVVKQRTKFQTQVLKAGESDVSHKDYIISWGAGRAKRGETHYTPNLRTAYGVEQETKQCVRLPMVRWPFDHCSVVTSFQPGRSRLGQALCNPRGVRACVLACVVAAALLLPLASPERESPYGPPGTWHHTSRERANRAGICETPVPCPGTDWTPYRGSCYLTTPRLPHKEAQGFCQRFRGHLVSIGSDDENQFVSDTACPQGQFCWIGLQGSPRGEELWWSSGEPVNYTQLASMEASEVFPLFPIHREDEEQLTLLSNLPGDVEGCNLKFLVMRHGDGPPSLNALLAGPALAMIVSAVLLACPRPFAWRTGLYLMLAFCVNLCWYSLSMYGACFVADDEGLALSLKLVPRVSECGHIFTASMALWLILRRMALLYPAKQLAAVFVLLLACSLAYSVLLLAVTDALRALVQGPLGVLLLALIGAIAGLHLLFAALITPDLYGTWSCMMREATTGVSAEGGSTLHHALRAARIHFFAILAAIWGGVLHWTVTLAAVVSLSQPASPTWAMHSLLVSNVVSSAANDLCAHFLAVLKLDEAVVWSKDINREVAKRAQVEVEEHQLAVNVLKAAPTTKEHLRKLSSLEKSARRDLEDTGDEDHFWLLQSEVRAESSRIHRLMHCVRVRFMTMPLRYQYLLNIPCVAGTPRQHVPAHFASGAHSDEAASAYLDWLYAEADGAQQVLFHTMRQLLDRFNSTPWPSDLGLVREQFPWTIWASGPSTAAARPLQHAQAVSPGDILLYSPDRTLGERLLGRNHCIHCVVLEDHKHYVQIHRGGMEEPEEVERGSLRTCSGGGVFVPGPKKKKQRCVDKIVADYGGSEPWPPAASVCDFCRCMILLPDPYAIAVLVAYIQKTMRVVRVKNRFSEDVMESVSPEELQAMFHSASSHTGAPAQAARAEAGGGGGGGGGGASPPADAASHDDDRQYRDVALNVEIVGPKGVPFICEIQVTLSNLAILKHAEQKLYTIRRMQSPQELRTTYVFSEGL